MSDPRRLFPLTLLPLLALPGCAHPITAPPEPNAIDLLVAPWTPETQHGLIGPPVPPRLLAPPPLVTPPLVAPATMPRLTLQRTSATGRLGDPIWRLDLSMPDGTSHAFTAVSGRAYAQNRDRNVSGLKAPLPPGLYKLGTIHRSGFSSPEIGGYAFIDLIPQFPTGRSDLGIHNDKSFDLNPGGTGTDGCVGLLDQQQLQQLVKLLSPYPEATLNVLN